jgi:hypothetical protein
MDGINPPVRGAEKLQKRRVTKFWRNYIKGRKLHEKIRVMAQAKNAPQY